MTEIEQRLLADAASLDRRWSEAAAELSWEGWDVAMQAEYYGLRIADAAARGELAVSDLRDFVTWANDLDRDAVEVSGGDIEVLDGADYREALARRIAHHSGRTALQLVHTSDRLDTHRIQYRRRVARLHDSRNVGLFRLEAHDLGL